MTKIEFLTDRLARWQVSLDFTVPSDSDIPGLDYPGQEPIQSVDVLVPVALVRKVKLANVDLEDEAGRSLPALNRDIEFLVTAVALAALWNDLCPDRRLSPQAVAALRDLSYAIDEDDAADAYGRLRALVPSGLTSQQRDLTKTFWRFCRILRTYSIFYAVLPNARPGERRIVKMSLDDVVPWELPSRRVILDRQRRKGRRRSTRPLSLAYLSYRGILRDPLSRLGVLSRPFSGRFPTYSARSVHLEVTAPEGCVFSGGVLVDPDGRVLDEVPRGSLVGHLYLNNSAGVIRSASYEVRLRSQRTGWLRISLITTVLIAGLLWLVHEYPTNSTVSASLITGVVGIGAIVVVFLAKPTEHHLTRVLLGGPRLALVVAALAGLVDVVALAFSTLDHPRPWIGSALDEGWGVWTFATAVICSLVILGNYFGEYWGRLRQRLF